MSNNYIVAAVERAILLLFKLRNAGKPMGVSELSKEIDIPKASTFRILQTLEKHKMVIEYPERQEYTLGPSILQLSNRVKASSFIELASNPYLKELALSTEETANLAILQGNKVLITKTEVGRIDPKLTLSLGPIADIHSSSLGKALISETSPQEITNLIGQTPLPQHTKNTITTIDELLEELQSVREAGISMDIEETEEGLICIGAPIYDWRNKIIAAISLSGPKSRMDEDLIQHAKVKVRKFAERISKELSRTESSNE